MRLVVAISGATGSIFGIRLLEALRAAGGVETHLIISKWGQRTLEHETTLTAEAVRRLADATYNAENMAAPLSSGSFSTDGMVVAPCSVKTLGAVAGGISDSLIARAAEVTLKEGRKLVLLVRETPLSAIHLENMLKLARLGAVILPPVPAFYNHPVTLDDMVDHVVARVLDHFRIPFARARRWDGRLRPPATVQADRPPGPATDEDGGQG
jgi:4-hydroxy-3-polyprenylbenzoate decarboxylase